MVLNQVGTICILTRHSQKQKHIHVSLGPPVAQPALSTLMLLVWVRYLYECAPCGLQNTALVRFCKNAFFRFLLSEGRIMLIGTIYLSTLVRSYKSQLHGRPNTRLYMYVSHGGPTSQCTVD